MNPGLEKAADARLARCEADLAACVGTLFRRCRPLAGFTVSAGGIQLADMTCHPAQDDQVLKDMREYITGVLTDLADEQPGTALLMNGRTFARFTH
jgi:hypothetical protein